MTEENLKQELTDEEAILKIAEAMKGSTPAQEERQNVHTFLLNVVQEKEIEKTMKIGNLRDDNELNELGVPKWHVRGALEMARISEKLMNNDFFKDYFVLQAGETLGTSLSRDGFFVRQATVQTKQVADITRRKKINKGMFGKKKVEESGGDTISGGNKTGSE